LLHLCYNCSFLLLIQLSCGWLLQALDEIKNIHVTNTRLQSQLEVLQKRRITNFAKLYQTLKGKELQT
jgi:L-lysine 2,3-aminomutase